MVGEQKPFSIVAWLIFLKIREVDALPSVDANLCLSKLFIRNDFFTIERVFAWKISSVAYYYFERISELLCKSLAYTMINLRHFCQS